MRAARSKTTGHYRRPGTRDLYCARPAGAPNDEFATLRGWKMCARCVKAEAADRAAATATAEAWLDTRAADKAARTSADTYFARNHPHVSALLGLDNDARLIALREAITATGGTWNTDRVDETLTAAGMPTDVNTCWGFLRYLATTERVLTPSGRRAFTAPEPRTWRAEWIGARARSTAPTLFDVDPDTEQGALFA